MTDAERDLIIAAFGATPRAITGPEADTLKAFNWAGNTTDILDADGISDTANADPISAILDLPGRSPEDRGALLLRLIAGSKITAQHAENARLVWEVKDPPKLVEKQLVENPASGAPVEGSRPREADPSLVKPTGEEEEDDEDEEEVTETGAKGKGKGHDKGVKEPEKHDEPPPQIRAHVAHDEQMGRDLAGRLAERAGGSTATRDAPVAFKPKVPARTPPPTSPPPASGPSLSERATKGMRQIGMAIVIGTLVLSVVIALAAWSGAPPSKIKVMKQNLAALADCKAGGISEKECREMIGMAPVEDNEKPEGDQKSTSKGNK